MGQTGYEDQDFMSRPAYMLDARISPNAVPDINQLARQSKTTPEQVVDSLVNSAFSYFEDSVEEALQTNVARMSISYFENCPISVVVSVKDNEISAMVVARYEAGSIEGAMQMGNGYVDLDWLGITFEDPQIISNQDFGA